jgi:hypothetical protein
MNQIKFTDTVVTLRSVMSGQANKGVDKDKRMMYGVVVAEAMQIKDYRGSDYGLELDTTFINDMVAFAKKQKDGVIVNFGHNWNNLEARLGRMTNFAINDNRVNADLKVLTSADSTPGRNGLGTHVLNLAEEDPGMMGFSIKFSYKYMYQRDSGGKEVKCYYYDRAKDQYFYPSPELGPVYFKFDKLTSVDLVDEGAATNTLFRSQEELAQAAHDLLNTPGIEDVLAKNKYPVLEQLYSAQKPAGSIIDSLKALLGLNKDELHSVTTQNKEEVDQETFNKLQADVTAKEAEITALKAANETLTTQVTTATTTLADLAKRMDELEKTPQGKHSMGNEEEEAPPVELKAYEQNPINQKWMNGRK